MTQNPHLEFSRADGVGLVRLKRPQKMNALDAQMVKALGSLCDEIEHSEDVHVVIFSGSDGVFCAGGDIHAWSDESATDFGRHWVRDGHDAFDRLARLRQPVIAVLNGHALGGGLELAACADYRIAEKQVKIGQPEASIGIISGWSGTQRAVRRWGSQWVRRMSIFGEVLQAEDALRAGIVDQVVETGSGLEAAQALAKTVLKRGRVACELTKMLVNAAEGEEVDRVLESFAGRIAASSKELKEGVAAFKDKRKPDFDGIKED